MSSDPTPDSGVDTVFERVRGHEFHPLDADSFTIDRHLRQHGIEDLQDPDWRVRLLAVRDLIRAGPPAARAIASGLDDDNLQIRYVAATALGVLRAVPLAAELEQVVRADSEPLARAAAVVALGEMESQRSLDLLRNTRENDPSSDVRHQAELVIYQIDNRLGASDALRHAWDALDESSFGRVVAGETAPDFVLPDARGNEWRLQDACQQGSSVVLIWIFAHWCPVCHREFSELIELRDEFRRSNVQVATLECHDTYRCRVMTGRELDPDYWFAERSFKEDYVDGIWWPHLADRAGRIGAAYGIDPMAFSVHAEYINRPATIIIDPAGTVRFAYFGTYWGDRPSIAQTLDMIRNGSFEFDQPERPTPTKD